MSNHLFLAANGRGYASDFKSDNADGRHFSTVYSTVGKKFAAKVRNSAQRGGNGERPNRLALARLSDDAG